MSAASGSSDRVWYAAYGSNLLAERFACYLAGGRFRDLGRPHQGARDPSAATGSAAVVLPHTMRFARESARWGGGVSFLDPIADPSGPGAHVRLWSITVEQFCDVASQENGLRVGEVDMTAATFDTLVGDGQVRLADTWYGTAVCLGEHAGDPILTFTAAAPPQPTVPGAAYLSVILDGLVESGAVDGHNAAVDYLLGCPGVADGWDRAGLRALSP